VRYNRRDKRIEGTPKASLYFYCAENAMMTNSLITAAGRGLREPASLSSTCA
jgi:hypothetical protein